MNRTNVVQGGVSTLSIKRGLNVGYSGPGLGGLAGGVGGHQNDNVGKACEDAVAQSVTLLVQQLEKISWQASVVRVKDGRIALNCGPRDGVSVGMRFDVGQSEDVVDEDTGEVTDSSLTIAGSVEVTEVKEKIAYGKALTSGEAPAKGMSAFPAK